jgi:signal transduction histidine kinase
LAERSVWQLSPLSNRHCKNFGARGNKTTPEKSMSKERIDEIKKELGRELGKKTVDFGRISTLAAELSTLDSETAAFSVNATIIRRLGRELVAAHETAVAELVKNAFDADASYAKVIFSGTAKAGGRLIIEDDGVGMTPDQVRDGFLRIASDQKEVEPVSPLYHRKRAGQKGIGRFAVERLGKQLRLITATDDDKLATELTIDWAAFEKSAELIAVRHPIKRVPKASPHGTMLIVDGLREPWSIDAIQTAESYVNDLAEPRYFNAYLPDDAKPPTSRRDPGFSVEFSVLDGVMPKAVPGAEAEVVNSATALLDASIDEYGEWKVHIISTPHKLDRTFTIRDVRKDEKNEWKFEHLRSMRLRAAYFVRESELELVGGIKRAKLNRMLRTRGGIKLYLNRFRVAPYGSPGDDWLNLDRLETMRHLLVPIKSTNWVGFVSIQDPDNNRAIETSSREGLVQNEFLGELVEFTRKALTWLAVEVGRARKKKIYASDVDFGQAKSERALRAATTISKYLGELQKARQGGATGYTKDAITDATLADIRVELEKMLKDASELVGEVAVLRVFASVGMSVLMFSHEVKSLLVGMQSQIDELVDDDSLAPKIKRHLRVFRGMLDRLQHLTGFYESTGSVAADRTVSGVDVLSMVNGFVESFAPQAKKRGITLRFEGDPTLPIRTVAMHEAELSSVLINLYTNAVKAIQRHPNARNREVVMRHSRAGNLEIIDVLDTGVGIRASEKENIFKPFYTTTPVKRALRPGDPEMFGAGLGLTIARDSVRAARGTIEVVVPPPQGYSTCIRMELPQIPHEQDQVPMR